MQQIAKSKLYEKKGQIQNGTVTAIIMLVVGIGVAVLVLVFVGTLGGSTFELLEDDIDAIANNDVASEAFTPLNGTEVSLAHGFVQEGTLVVFNTTDSPSIGLGNFTIDYDAGSMLLTTGNAEFLNNTNHLVNYTWGAAEIRTHVKNSIVGGFEALETTGDYMPIVVLAVVIALVLAIVMGFTAIGGMGGAKTSAL